MSNINGKFPKSSMIHRTPPRESAASVEQASTAADCKICNGLNAIDDMVACDNCGSWFHFSCVGVTQEISKEQWSCSLCRPSTSYENNVVSKPKSVVSRRSSNLSNRTRSLALARLEAERERQVKEREIREKEEKDYIEKKFAILSMLEEDETQGSIDSRSVSSAKSRVKSWLQGNNRATDQPEQTQNYLKPRPTTTAPEITEAISNFTPPNTTSVSIPSDLLKSVPYPQNQVTMVTTNDCQLANVHTVVHGGPTATYNNQAPILQHLSVTGPATATTTSYPSCQVATSSQPLILAGTEFVNSTIPVSVGNLPIQVNAAVRSPLTSHQLAARQVLSKELPIFTGQPEDWPLFISSYENSTATCGFSDAENLLRLQKGLRGNALEAVRNQLLLPTSVTQVIGTLRMLYGRPEMVMNRLLKKLRSHPDPKPDKLEILVSYALTVENLSSTMQATGLLAHLNNPMLLQELVDKLPANIKLNWAMYKQQVSTASISTFSQWLTQIARSISDVTLSTFPLLTSESTYEKRRQARGNTFINKHENVPPTVDQNPKDRDQRYPSLPMKRCLICDQNCKSVTNCKKFIEMSHSARWNSVRQKSLCRKCLSKHGKYNCKSSSGTCGKNNCILKHHPLLHNDNWAPVRQEQIVNQPSNCHTHRAPSQHILFRIVPVNLYGKNRMIETFAFLDDGSSLTLMEDDLANQLGLSGDPEPLCLKWTANTHRSEEKSKRVSLRISGTKPGMKRFCIPSAHTVNSLDLPEQTVSMETLTKRYKHLQGLPIRSYKNAKPRILIGLDNWRLGLTLKFRENTEVEPVATKTRLGWSVHGPFETTTNDRLTTTFSGFHGCDCCHKNVDGDIHQLVKNYFSLENFGVNAPANCQISKEDQRSLDILEQTTIRQGKHFETGLLWKYDDVKLPDSMPMAIHRFQCLEKKMKRDPHLGEFLKQKMRDHREKGYIEKLSEEETKIQYPRLWYLPTFVVSVSKPSKPNKLRIVWDAAAKVNGFSLNSVLMKGPDQLTPLVSVLYRFRQNAVAITGDIAEMFHQVRIKSADQLSQRFLWREKPSGNVEIYKMKVMAFGASCSPSSAQYVKNKNAEEFITEFPRAVESIIKSHYVDDMLDSVKTAEEAIRLAKEVRYIHQQGGFQIRNWVTNSKQVANALSETTLHNYKNLNVEPELGTEKVLGMWWSTDTDTFKYLLTYSKDNEQILRAQRKPSKREVLRIMMKIFDPLGLIANYLVYIKILLQDIWRSSVGWDDDIHDADHDKWLTWVHHLPSIEEVRIPRCYFPGSLEDQKEIQLHVFVDASSNAYAAVAYLRIRVNDRYHCSLIGAKTKVAPLNLLSIPRLELQAALLGVRFARSLAMNHAAKITSRHFWSDSQTVLSWLNSDHRTYRQFVAFRVGEILDSSNVHEWRWVSSKHNVADEATKWQRTPDLGCNSRWLNGPPFLSLQESHWPPKLQNLATTEEEMNPHLLHGFVTRPNPIDILKFSRWKKLLRVTAFVFRFLGNTKQLRKDKNIGPLSQEEYRTAESYLYRQAQSESYPDEITTLTRNLGEPNSNPILMGKDSPLFKESPYLDEAGVLRVRGRIDAVQGVDDTTKRPILLPQKHHITQLVMRFYHEKYHHHNHETVVNELRQLFSIPRLRVALKKMRKNCQTCKNRHAAPKNSEMAALPTARLSPFTRPFSYIGVDYFGPINVAVGRRREKRWGMLITCLTTRAVHLEIAHSLTTDSCIIKLRNFIARRGNPIEIHSDNGTNFQGAEAELRRSYQDVDQQKLAECFTTSSTKWVFIPPSSPHMGGSWERLVRSIKTTLYKISPTHTPSDELLRGMLMEVESIVNSRPLTYIPIDDENSEALTPNHFLLGSSGGSKPVGEFNDERVVLKKNWMTAQSYANHFWRRWILEYLPTLTRRTKWHQRTEPIKVGDVVIIVDDKGKRNTWVKGRIIAVKPSKDGQIRQATVQTVNGIYVRPTAKLAVLDVGIADIGKSAEDKAVIPRGSVASAPAPESDY